MKSLSTRFRKLNKNANVFSLINNFIYLIGAQGINFIIPILIIPFLVKNIGVTNFGLVMTGQALATYFYVLNDYGFALTATKSCAIHKQDSEALSKIVSEVLYSKFLLFSINVLIIAILYLTANYRNGQSLFWFYSFSLILGKLFIPTWFFQGVEDMKYISILNLASKAFLFLTLYLVIKKPEDFIYVNLLYGLSDILVTLIGWLIIYKKYKLKVYAVNLSKVFIQLQSGIYVFTTLIIDNAYLNSSLILLNAFATPTVVGIYAIAEKVMVIFKQIISIFLQATYPFVCKLASISLEELKDFLKKEFYIVFLLTILVYGGIFLFSNFIINYLTGSPNISIQYQVVILSVIPIITGLRVAPYQMLIVNNLKKGFVSITIIGLLFYLLIFFCFKAVSPEYAMIASIFGYEVFATISSHFILRFVYVKYALRYT
jgi:polysaccharide transporter, PST family